MSGDKKFEETQSTTTATTDHIQRQNEVDVVSIKDCSSSDLTSPVTSSRDVTARFAGVHESEALPYYSSVSSSVGVQNETASHSVFAKDYPKSSTSSKQNSLESTQRNGSSRSTLSKPMTHRRKEIEILNKAPHLHSNFTAAPPPRTYPQPGNFLSFANSRRHVFPSTNYRPNTTTNYRPNTTTNHRPNTTTNYRPNTTTNYRPNTTTNYRPNGSGSNSNDRFLSGDKFRSGESEMSKEMTRGPRCHQNNSHPQSSVVKDEFAITPCRDRYNLPDFKTEYETAKFYMIKSFNEDDIHKGIKYDVWTSTPNGNKRLNAAFHDAEAKLSQTDTPCPVFLFFSVNGSGQFVGVAEMLGPVDFKKDLSFWKLDKYNGFFPIKWHIVKDVPNRLFLHITLQNNDNRCVTFSRDTQEIGLKEGLEMLNIFKSYSAKTCLLDDFDFYENREKLSRSQRTSTEQRTRPHREVYSNNDYYYHNTVKAREEKIEMQSSSGSKQVTNLVNRTRNLSLNPSVKRGFR